MLEARIKQEITEGELKQNLEEYNKEIEQINNDIIKLQQEIKENKEDVSTIDFYKLLEQIISFDKIDKSILIQLIDRIEIFQDKTVKIHYKFARP